MYDILLMAKLTDKYYIHLLETKPPIIYRTLLSSYHCPMQQTGLCLGHLTVGSVAGFSEGRHFVLQ